MGPAAAALPKKCQTSTTLRAKEESGGVGRVLETFGGQGFPIFALCPTIVVPRKVNAYSVGVPYKQCKLPG